MEPEEKGGGSRSSSEILSTDSSESEDDFSISVSVSSSSSGSSASDGSSSSPEVDGSDDVSSDTVSSTTVSSTTVRGSTRESSTHSAPIDERRRRRHVTSSERRRCAVSREDASMSADLSSIVSFLDGLKAGWGLRFAGAFGAVGLEDVLDLDSETTPAELALLEDGLKARGARLRHLRIIKSAVLGQILKASEPSTPSHSMRGQLPPSLLTEVDSSPWTALPGSEPSRSQSGAVASVTKVKEEEDEEDEEDDEEDDGNVRALIAFFQSLGGPNWITRRGWRGEKPQAKQRQRSAIAGLHGVTFQSFSVPQHDDGAGDREARRRGAGCLGVAPPSKVVLQAVSLRLRFNGLCGRLGDDRYGLCSGDFEAADRRPQAALSRKRRDASSDRTRAGHRDSRDSNDNFRRAHGDAGEPGVQASEFAQVPKNARALLRTFPWALRFPRLTDLDLSGNSLTGPIPRALARLSLLTVLNLGQNSLTGQLPRASSDAVLLAPNGCHLLRDLAFDREVGLPNQSSVVSSLGNSSDTSHGGLRGGAGGGAGFGSLTRLRSLSLRQNVLTGPLTGGRLPASLTLCNLSHNRFSGPVPRVVSRMAGLRVLKLDHNHLTGDLLRLPAEVEIVDLRQNRLVGPFASLSVADLCNLTKLTLTENAVPDAAAYAAERRLDNERLAAGHRDGFGHAWCERRQKFLPADVSGESRIRPSLGSSTVGSFEAERAVERWGAPLLGERPGEDDDDKGECKGARGPVSSLSDDARPSVVNQAASATGGSTNLLRKRPELSYLANAEIKVVGAQQDLAWRARNAGALQRAKAAEGTAKNLASPRRPRSLIRAAILNGVPTKRPPVASSTSVSRSYGDVESRAISSRGWSAFFPTQRSSDRFSRMETPAVEEGHHEMALEEHPKYGVVWLRGLGRYKLRTAYDAAREEHPSLDVVAASPRPSHHREDIRNHEPTDAVFAAYKNFAYHDFPAAARQKSRCLESDNSIEESVGASEHQNKIGSGTEPLPACAGADDASTDPPASPTTHSRLTEKVMNGLPGMRENACRETSNKHEEASKDQRALQESQQQAEQGAEDEQKEIAEKRPSSRAPTPAPWNERSDIEEVPKLEQQPPKSPGPNPALAGGAVAKAGRKTKTGSYGSRESRILPNGRLEQNPRLPNFQMFQF